jgi:hypothetical protein
MRIICKRDRYRYIRLPLRFINRQFNIDHNTYFCVDTGAPYSLVTYEQAFEWKVPLHKLKPTPSTHRVGGIEGPGYVLEDSIMLFRDSSGTLHPFDVPKIVVIGPPPSSKQKTLPVPALLGDDILRQFTLIVESDRHGGEVIITDEIVSINPPPSYSH